MTASLKDLRELLDRERTAAGQLRGASRSAAVALIEQLHAGGTSYREIAAGVDVQFQTLMSWRFKRATTPPTAPAFVPVRVEAAELSPSRTLTLHMPRGMRVEGLSLDELAALLLRLTS